MNDIKKIVFTFLLIYTINIYMMEHTREGQTHAAAAIVSNYPHRSDPIMIPSAAAMHVSVHTDDYSSDEEDQEQPGSRQLSHSLQHQSSMEDLAQVPIDGQQAHSFSQSTLNGQKASLIPSSELSGSARFSNSPEVELATISDHRGLARIALSRAISQPPAPGPQQEGLARLAMHRVISEPLADKKEGEQ